MATDDEQGEGGRPKRGTVLCNRRVDGPYTVIPNALIQGSALKPEAFRLLAYIASLPEDWNLRIGQAAKQCLMGRDRTYNALADLEELNLARLMAERASNGRIVRRWWEFTLTPGQWKAPNPENQEMGSNIHILNFRKRRTAPNPENQEKAKRPFPEPPDMASRTLQSNKSTKSNQFALAGVPPAMPPEAWPFPKDDKATKTVRKLGLEPEAVWQQYQQGKVTKPHNLAGYLVTIAKRMALAEEGNEAEVELSPAAREALAAFNAAAATHRFTPCRTPTDAQAKRLDKRLKGVGGLGRFKRALGALPSDDFLMGRVRAKDGGKPFRLNIDRLLRTDGPMGDVLGRLLGLADEADASAAPGASAGPSLPARWWRDKPAMRSSIGAAGWRHLINQHAANGTWREDMLGPPPDDPGCVIPREFWRDLTDVFGNLKKGTQ